MHPSVQKLLKASRNELESTKELMKLHPMSPEDSRSVASGISKWSESTVEESTENELSKLLKLPKAWLLTSCLRSSFEGCLKLSTGEPKEELKTDSTC